MIADAKLFDEHARIYRSGADAVVGDTLLDPGSPRGFLSDSIRAWIDAARIDAPLTAFDIWAGQLSVRRSVFEELGGFDDAFTSDGAFANEDADFGVGLLQRFNVRHNPAAISRQRYVVGPQELMKRASLWGSGDIRFVSKHPQLTRDLFEARGIKHRRTRFLYRPLASIPFVPAILSVLGVGVAKVALKTPVRSSRLLARFFDVTRSVAYWADLRRRGWFPTSERLLVLCYHSIDRPAGSHPDRFTVSRADFEMHLDGLSARGFTFVTPEAFAAYLLNDAPMPKRAVLLTFDDGYADLLETARSVLQPRGIRALAFVLTNQRSDHNDWDTSVGAPTRRLLTPQEMLQLANLGSRSPRMVAPIARCPGSTSDESRQEVEGSIADLESLGLKPRFFAYPFGEVSSESIDAAREGGFVAAFGIDARWVSRESPRFNVPGS